MKTMMKEEQKRMNPEFDQGHLSLNGRKGAK